MWLYQFAFPPTTQPSHCWVCTPNETRIEKDTRTPTFVVTLITIARTWKHPRCPSEDEWIRKLWYIYTMDYYSPIKKNAFESILMRWVNPEPIYYTE